MPSADYNRMKAFSNATIESYEDEHDKIPIEILLRLYLERKLSAFHLVTSDHSTEIGRVELLTKFLEEKNAAGKISRAEKDFLNYLLEAVEIRKQVRDEITYWSVFKENILQSAIENLSGRPVISEIRKLVIKLIKKVSEASSSASQSASATSVPPHLLHSR